MAKTTTDKNVTTSKWQGVIKARQAGERASWALSDSLLLEWLPGLDKDGNQRTNLEAIDYSCDGSKGYDPANHSPGEDCCLQQAQMDAGLEPLGYSAARQYRKVSEFWPVAERKDGLGYSHHRVLKDTGKLASALNIIRMAEQDPNVQGDLTKVSVAMLKGLMGQGTGDKVKGTLSIAQLTQALGLVRVGSDKPHHLAKESAEDLNAYIGALTKALTQAQSHLTTRQGKGAQSKAKAQAKAQAKSKGKAKGQAPAQARG